MKVFLTIFLIIQNLMIVVKIDKKELIVILD